VKKLITAIIVFLVVVGIGRLPTILERQESNVSTSVETPSTSGAAQNLRGPRSTALPITQEEVELSILDFDEAIEDFSRVPRNELIKQFNPEPLQSKGFIESLTNRHPIDSAAAIYASSWGRFVGSLDLPESERNQLKTMLVAYDAYNIELRNLFMTDQISFEEFQASRRSLEQLAELLSPMLTDEQMDLFWNENDRLINQSAQRRADWDAQKLANGLVGILDAANRNDTATVAAYINSGADVNAMTLDGRKTPLLDAASHDNIEMVRILLEAGANPNTTSADGFETTPLRRAASGGYTEIIRALAAAGADLNFAGTGSPDFTPLATAAQYGQIEVVITLLDLGADATGTAGSRALYHAVEYGNNEMELLLIEAGATENLMTKTARDIREIGRRMGVVND